jgi:tetratricopeptide (TPR) repeat protein
VAAISYLVAVGTRKAREYYWFSRVRSGTTFGGKLNALKQAAAADPRNFETTYAIGESLRQLSWQGEPGFESLATEAIEWFQRGTRLNPFDAYNYMRTGMCLDWLGRHAEAGPYFLKALRIDPNNYFLQAHQGWHYVQTGDYELARLWFKRSMDTHASGNFIAFNYLQIVEQKLKEGPPSKK